MTEETSMPEMVRTNLNEPRTRDSLSPVTKAKILTLAIAAHWGTDANSDCDSDDTLASDTAQVAWIAHQALAELSNLAPDVAERLARQAEDAGIDIPEMAEDALAAVIPDPRWTHDHLHIPRFETSNW